MMSMGKRIFSGSSGRKRLYNWTVGCELVVDDKAGEVVVGRIWKCTPAHFCGKLAEVICYTISTDKHTYVHIHRYVNDN